MILPSNSAFLSFCGGDVGRDLDDLQNRALRIHHGIVGGLNPDLAAALADALVFARVEFAAAELGPEFFVVGAARVVRVDEQAVVFAYDLREAVAQRLAEIFVRGEDFSRRVELDDGERPTERVKDCLRSLSPKKHVMAKHEKLPLSGAISRRCFGELAHHDLTTNRDRASCPDRCSRLGSKT